MKMSEEEYLFLCLAEECNEVAQRISKAFRFGLDEIQVSNPNETRNNKERIKEELIDLHAVVELLVEKDYLKVRAEDSIRTKQKRDKLDKYMEYSRKQGTLL